MKGGKERGEGWREGEGRRMEGEKIKVILSPQLTHNKQLSKLSVFSEKTFHFSPGYADPPISIHFLSGNLSLTCRL